MAMPYRKDHIAKGCVCPFCADEDSLEGEGVEVCGNTAKQVVRCTSCDGEWEDTYMLVSVEEY